MTQNLKTQRSELGSAKSKRSGNRERVIEASIELMNLHGGSIKTSQIADVLGISPGNLYYHFRNFGEIAVEVLALLRADLKEHLKLPSFGSVSAAQLVGYYTGGARILWRHRYMVSAGRELVTRVPALEESYREFTKEGVEGVRLIIENLVEHHPSDIQVDKQMCMSLAENMWVLWIGWPRYIEAIKGQNINGLAVSAEGMQQVAFTLSPYVNSAFQDTVIREMADCVRNLKSANLQH